MNARIQSSVINLKLFCSSDLSYKKTSIGKRCLVPKNFSLSLNLISNITTACITTTTLLRTVQSDQIYSYFSSSSLIIERARGKALPYQKSTTDGNVDSADELGVGVVLVPDLEGQTLGCVANFDSKRLVPKRIQ